VRGSEINFGTSVGYLEIPAYRTLGGDHLCKNISLAAHTLTLCSITVIKMRGVLGIFFP